MCAAFNRKIGGILLQQQQEAHSPLSRGLGGGLEAPGAEGGWRACQRQEPTGEPAPPSLSPAVSQERYTCPSLTLHPREPVFLAQTNGNYLALFSAVWPYRMSRRRRYEGHKVPHLVPSPRGWKVVPRPRRQGTPRALSSLVTGEKGLPEPSPQEGDPAGLIWTAASRTTLPSLPLSSPWA